MHHESYLPGCPHGCLLDPVRKFQVILQKLAGKKRRQAGRKMTLPPVESEMVHMCSPGFFSFRAGVLLAGGEPGQRRGPDHRERGAPRAEAPEAEEVEGDELSFV